MNDDKIAPDAAPRPLEIGVFAHNESGNIAATLETLDRQSVLGDPRFRVRIHVLANGCSDDTVDVAKATIAAMGRRDTFVVHDLAEGGKSRTWNRFVHDLSAPEAPLLVLCDADIVIPDPGVLGRLVGFLDQNPACLAASSRAVKDIAHFPQALSVTDRLIVAASGTLHDWRSSICGQLYAIRTDTARSFHLPIGLPVEDGFIRAMVMTDVLRGRSDWAGTIDSDEAIFHVYASERTIPALVRHQVRIVIGSAVNSVLYHVLGDARSAGATLEKAASDPDWVDRCLREALPRRYGYVPVRFLTRRLDGFWRTPFKRKGVLLVGFGFDALVYVIAQIRMARGVGAGFW